MDIIQDVTQEMGEMKLEATSHFFPQEIVHEILIRLPIKLVVRCTLVCKTWRSMIINRRFIRAHFSQNSTHLLLIHALPNAVYYNEKDMYIRNNEPTEELCSLHYDNHAFDEYCKIEFPTVQDLHNDFLRVVGICNGLVFLADDYMALGYTFIICNPCIRKSVTLPKPHLNYGACGPYDASMGFGYDAVTNDYKVVRLFTDQRDNPTAFEVYSLAKGSWSNPRCLDSVCIMSDRTPHTFVNGAIYWKALRVKNGAGQSFLLAFDVGSELFREVMMPKSLEGCSVGLDLSVLDRKSLAIVAFDDHLHDICIWVMKEHCGEDSWTRLVNLSIQNLQIPFISEVLCFKNSGEVVFVMGRCGDGTELASLDVAGKQFKSLGIRGYKHYYANSYKDSLVLLDKTDAVSY